MVIFGQLTSIELFIQERALFIHEKSSGFYRASAYFLAKVRARPLASLSVRHEGAYIRIFLSCECSCQQELRLACTNDPLCVQVFFEILPTRLVPTLFYALISASM